MASAATSTKQVSEKQKNKKQRGTQQSLAECESERDLATIGLTVKTLLRQQTAHRLAHVREIGLTTRVIQLKQLTSVTLVSLLLLMTMRNKTKNQQVNSKPF